MSKFFLRIGGLLFYSRRRQSVRGSIIFLLTNFLLIAGAIFTIEIIFIFLGMENIFLPMTRVTHSMWAFLTKLVY
jgi:hypothetical protein